MNIFQITSTSVKLKNGKVWYVLKYALPFVRKTKELVISADLNVENGQIVLRTQIAAAAEKHGIATVLPDNLHLNASEKYAEGSLGAPLTLYEFSSLGCPHCADFHLDVIPELKKEYVEKGLLRIVFVNFPLDKKSMEAAMVLQCASVDNYQGLLSRLFDKQRFWYLSGNTD